MMKSIRYSNKRHFLSMILFAIFITLTCGFSATAKPIKDKRVSEAAAAYENGEFQKALDLFQAAYADDPQSSYLYNIGRVYESNADYPNAVDYYTRFIRTPGSDEEAREDAMTRIDKLNHMIALTGGSGKGGGALPSGGCIDINKATVKELTALSGIGDKKAQDIIGGRPYRSVDDLTKVKGIGAKSVDKLRDQVCPIGGSASAPLAAPAPAAAPVPPRGIAAAPAPAAAPVPREMAAAPAAPSAGNCIDINSASLKDLTKLKGVGDKKAQDIIAGRPYRAINDLTKVKGIGNAAIDKIRDQVCPLGDSNAVAPVPVQPNTKPATPKKAPANPPQKSTTVIEI